MIDTRNISRKIMEKSIDTEDNLLEELNNLEEAKVEERYIVDIEEKTIKNLNSLLEYYDKLSTNVDKLNFYKFVLYVMKDEDTTNKFFQELKNLSLLTRTGLLKYAHQQENYSKQIISNFLLKLSKIEEDSEENILEQEMASATDKIKNIREYKGYFAPIGIVKEVENASEYNAFLDNIKLTEEEKIDALLMSLSFNVELHEQNLSMYELDLQKATDVIKNVFLTTNLDNIKKNAKKRKINSILKKINKPSTKRGRKKKKEEKEQVEEPQLIKITEEPQLVELQEEPKIVEIKDLPKLEEPVILDVLSEKNENKQEIELQRLEDANKLVRENKDRDPYDLFVDYYEILLGRKENNFEVINQAKEYLEKNHKLIDNLEDIVKQDLEDTYSVYKNNEDLREEVYKTTENIERLLTYEINNIFECIDMNDSENLLVLTNKVEPIVSYINNNLNKNNKKK